VDQKNTTHNVSLGTLYDFNKQVMLNQGKLGKKKLEEIKSELEEWFNRRLDAYAMLLCRERYDFTVFHLYEKQNSNPCKIAAEELIEVLKNRGSILSIEKNAIDGYIANDAWEIWVEIDGEAYAYYLFSCDDWVIEC